MPETKAECLAATTGRATTGIHRKRSSIKAAASDRRHDRDRIAVGDRGRFLLHITNVFVVEVNVHKGAQFAVFGVKVALQLRMLRDQSGQRFSDRARLHVNSSLLARVLAQWRWNVDFAHSLL